MTSTTADPLAELELDLTENGLEFLQRSVTEMNSDTVGPTNFKFAVVDLAAAVEVLLKARLVREHWTLICVYPDKVTIADMLAGSAKTINPEQTAIRLENVAGVALKAGGHAARVDELAKLRNRAIHFSVANTPTAALQAALGRALDFVLWFLGTEFRGLVDPDLEELVEEVIESLTTQVGQIKELVSERMASIEAELNSAEICVECPRCTHPTLTVLVDETAHCAFCLWKPADGNDCADEYANSVLRESRYDAMTEGGAWSVHPCVSCSADSLVEGIVQYRPDPRIIKHPPAVFACFSCGMTAAEREIEHCSRCGELTETSGDDGVPVCSNCWAHIMHD